MELDVFDRLMMLQILPERASWTTVKIVQDLRDALSFSEEEIEEFELREEEGNARWNPLKAKHKEIEIGKKAREIILKAFKDADEAGQIHLGWIPTLEKFGYGEESE